MITTVTLNTAIDKLYRMERVTQGEVMRVMEVHNTAGGKGLNVSKVAALLEEEVIATGFVGGFNGEYLVSLLECDKIRSSFTKIQGETRSCINVWDLSTGKSTEFLEPGTEVSLEELLRFEKDFCAAVKMSRVVTISGSIPKGVPEGYYQKLIFSVKEMGKQIIVDTSGAQLKNIVQAKPTMIKPNREEIEQLLGRKMRTQADCIAAVQEIRQNGIPCVAVSLGKEGVIFACDQGVFRGIPPHIAVQNTVGCGDSMVAGFAVALARNYSVEDTLRCAVGVSAANALTKETGSFLPKDFKRILPLVKIEKIN